MKILCLIGIHQDILDISQDEWRKNSPNTEQLWSSNICVECGRIKQYPTRYFRPHRLERTSHVGED